MGAIDERIDLALDSIGYTVYRCTDFNAGKFFDVPATNKYFGDWSKAFTTFENDAKKHFLAIDNVATTDTWMGVDADAAKTMLSDTETTLLNDILKLHDDIDSLHATILNNFKLTVDSDPEAYISYDDLMKIESDFKEKSEAYDTQAKTVEDFIQDLQDKYSKYGTIRTQDFSSGRTAFTNLCGDDEKVGYLAECRQKLIQFDNETQILIEEANLDSRVADLNQRMASFIVANHPEYHLESYVDNIEEFVSKYKAKIIKEYSDIKKVIDSKLDKISYFTDSELRETYGLKYDEILYLIKNNPELIDGLYEAAHTDSDKADEIYANIESYLYDYHINEMKNKDGTLNMDKICKYMQKDCMEVSMSEYLALCSVFDKMSNAEKAQFIRSSYTCEQIYDDRYTLGGGKGYYEYTRSTTLDMFARVYANNMGLSVEDFSTDNSNKEIEYANKRIKNYNMLYAVTKLTDRKFRGGTFDTASLNCHDDGDTLNVDISEINNNKDDDRKNRDMISIETTKTYQTYPGIGPKRQSRVYNKQFTIYGYDHMIGDLFLDADKEEARKLKVSKGQVIGEGIAQLVGQEAAQKGVEDIPFAGAALSLLTLYTDIQKDIREAEQISATAQCIIDGAEASNYLNKIECGGSLIVDQDGKTTITAYNYPKDDIADDVVEFNSKHPNYKVEYNPDTFISDLLSDEDYRNKLDPNDEETPSFFEYLDEDDNNGSNDDNQEDNNQQNILELYEGE